MGTSLAWRTDTQLKDAARLQLDEDPAIRVHDRKMRRVARLRLLR